MTVADPMPPRSPSRLASLHLELARVGLPCLDQAQKGPAEQPGGQKMSSCPGAQPLLRDRLQIHAHVVQLQLWDGLLDPGSMGRGAGIDARPVGGPTCISPAHHSGQQPDTTHFAGEGSPGVSLEKSGWEEEDWELVRLP
ncbi:laccase [Platysternon megacephalum]|uniref:Laccase n=1 Tax=Platysternon megacephalum TaxID=55544 RepID=A0A4D9DHK1_9SAUR|nr:laccase [Platysternon megacephalum]